MSHRIGCAYRPKNCMLFTPNLIEAPAVVAWKGDLVSETLAKTFQTSILMKDCGGLASDVGGKPRTSAMTGWSEGSANEIVAVPREILLPMVIKPLQESPPCVLVINAQVTDARSSLELQPIGMDTERCQQPSKRDFIGSELKVTRGLRFTMSICPTRQRQCQPLMTKLKAFGNTDITTFYLRFSLHLVCSWQSVSVSLTQQLLSLRIEHLDLTRGTC